MPPDSEECLLEDLTDAGGLGSFELLDDRPAALRPPDVSGRNLSVKGSIVRYVLYAVSALSVGVVVTWAFRGPIVSSDSKDDTLDTIRNFSNDSVVSTAPPTHTTMAMNSSSNSVIEVRSVTAASSGVSSVVTQALRSTSIPTQSHVQATSTTTVPAVTAAPENPAGKTDSTISSLPTIQVTTKVPSSSTSTETPSVPSPTAPCSSPYLSWNERCRPASELIKNLRCQQWPTSRHRPAPQISHIVYINLDSSVQRAQWMESQLNSLPWIQNFGVTVKRFSAVNASRAKHSSKFADIRARGFNQVKYPDVTGKWGGAGGLFSHLLVLEELQRHAAELIADDSLWLIIEDDAILKGDFVIDWEKLWPFVPDTWDLLRLGWFGGASCRQSVNEHIDLASWSDPPPHGPCSYCGSHAYVVNPARVDRVIQRIRQAHIMHADCVISAPPPPTEDLAPLLAFAVRPLLSWQNESFFSDRDVQDSRGKFDNAFVHFD